MVSDSILAAYKDAPLISGRALPSYQALRKTITIDYLKILQTGLKVFYVNFEPYSDHLEMFKDIRERTILKISQLHCEHPLFTLEENARFRAIHDYCHYAAQTGFRLHGEYNTYLYHAARIPQEAHTALYSEVVIQAAYFYRYGAFPTQKVWTLDCY